MEKLDLQTETNLLLAKQIIKKNNCTQDIVEWALRLMESGYSSDSLYILVGLDSYDVWNIDTYFKKALEELNIDDFLQSQALLDFYLIDHIRKAINNPSIMDDTLWRLSEVIYNTSYYGDRHLDFLFLYDELEELTEMSGEEYVIREFKAFIKKIDEKL